MTSLDPFSKAPKSTSLTSKSFGFEIATLLLDAMRISHACAVRARKGGAGSQFDGVFISHNQARFPFVRNEIM
jgi:hypothetical protein